MASAQRALTGDALQEVDVSEVSESRTPAGYKSDRKTSGLFAVSSAVGSYHVVFESRSEWGHLLDLTWREQPAFIATQPMLLRWQSSEGLIDHYPDFLMSRTSRPKLLVDVHLSEGGRYKQRFLAKALLTQSLCASLGWEYRLLDALPGQRNLNLTHLMRFRETSQQVREVADAVLRLSLPTTLGRIHDWGSATGSGGVALAAVFHLVSWQQLWLDLDRPIRSTTQLSASPGPTDLSTAWSHTPWAP